MTETQLQRMAQAAAVIRRVVGHDFRCHVPATWNPQPATRIQQQMQDLARETALLILQHDRGEPLCPYVNYDCCQYDKIDALSDALSEVGLMVEDKTGWWSGVYEVSKMNLTYEQADKLIDLLVEHFDQTCDTYEQAMVYAADGLRYNLGKFSPDELLRYAQGSGCPAAVAMLEESGDEETVNG